MNISANAPPFSAGFHAFFTFASGFLSQLGQLVRILMFHYIILWKRDIILNIANTICDLSFIQNAQHVRIHKVEKNQKH